MEKKRIRIFDKKDGVTVVELPEILKLFDGGLLNWSILYLVATGNLGEGISMPVFEEKIFQSPNGFFISWEDLQLLSLKFDQVIDITIIGCAERDLLRRYETDEEMFAACDIAIEMIDSFYGEIHSKEQKIISAFKEKFSKTTKIEMLNQ